jgi:cytochrome o ubiquinol oxidase subunit 1
MVWYIWWLAAVAFAALLAVAIGHTFNYHRDYFVAPEEVARIEAAATRA